MTVGELLARISSRELSEWLAFYSLEPFGSDIPLLGSAITSATIANVHRVKGSKAYTSEDFMPKLGSSSSKKKQTVQEQLQFATMITAAFGGSNETGEK